MDRDQLRMAKLAKRSKKTIEGEIQQLKNIERGLKNVKEIGLTDLKGLDYNEH